MQNTSRLKPVLTCLLLCAVVMAIYWQVGGHDFVGIDDPAYVSENALVSGGLTSDAVARAFWGFHEANWHPLTWLSHMLDVELFGMDAGWHHRVNAMIHVLNTVLLFLVLWWMTGDLWRSALVAALFGVHPLHVESVAWISERKDVLSTLFWILTMGAYHWYVQHPNLGRYIVVACVFVLGLLCKPMLVTLPFVLLLLDFWPLGRLTSSFWRVAGEKVPLLVLSAMSCATTYLAQSSGDAVVAYIPFHARISNAIVSYLLYLGKTVWPTSLAVFYPHPWLAQVDIPAYHVLGSALLIGGVSIVSLLRYRRNPYLAVGWLWYLGTLVPVIGIVQVGEQAMADRYTYVPLIGIFISIAWTIPALLDAQRFRRLAAGASLGAVIALSVAAWTQAGYWHNGTTLFSRAVAVTERNWLALNNLGAESTDRGRYGQALVYLREALRVRPAYPEAWYNLGSLHDRLGQFQDAIGCYREAIRVWPSYARAWNNLGVAYGEIGNYQKALEGLAEAVRINPNYARAWYNSGVVHDQLGQTRQAVACYREAVRIKPDYASAQDKLSAAINRLDRSR